MGLKTLSRPGPVDAAGGDGQAAKPPVPRHPAGQTRPTPVRALSLPQRAIFRPNAPSPDRSPTVTRPKPDPAAAPTPTKSPAPVKAPAPAPASRALPRAIGLGRPIPPKEASPSPSQTPEKAAASVGSPLRAVSLRTLTQRAPTHDRQDQQDEAPAPSAATTGGPPVAAPKVGANRKASGLKGLRSKGRSQDDDLPAASAGLQRHTEVEEVSTTLQPRPGYGPFDRKGWPPPKGSDYWTILDWAAEGSFPTEEDKSLAIGLFMGWTEHPGEPPAPEADIDAEPSLQAPRM